MRSALFALLFGAFVEAGAQNHLLAEAPPGFQEEQALAAARQVFAARGWSLQASGGRSFEAEKSNSEVRISVRGNAVRFADLSMRERGERGYKQRQSRQLSAVPQAELDALRADLAAAFAGVPPVASGKPPPPPSQVLVSGVPAADPARVMDKVRLALVSRGWKVLPDKDAAVVVAQNRSGETDVRMRIFLADGALRYVDQSTQRNGKAQVPERWIGYLRGDLQKSLGELPATAAPADDAGERLRKLKTLLDGGLITPAEYESKRAEILKGL